MPRVEIITGSSPSNGESKSNQKEPRRNGNKEKQQKPSPDPRTSGSNTGGWAGH